MKKIIWMCWFQGYEDMLNKSPNSLNSICISRWISLNPDWEVKILSQDTIADYVPEYFKIVDRSPCRSMPARADLLRILLLEKFGGVWVDATVYPMKPLSEFYNEIVNQTGFFTYRYIPRGGYRREKKCETVSWFLCVNKPNFYLITKWKEEFVKRFMTFGRWPYFTFHHSLTFLYDKDFKVKKILDDMVQINEKIPHSAETKDWANKDESYVYKRPKLPKFNRADL